MTRSLLIIALAALVGSTLVAQRPSSGPRPKAPKPVLNPADGVPGARWPSVSPSGETVVFTLHGDIWSMASSGGRATRLTLNEAYDSRPMVTPDGQDIVFISDRTGSYDIFIMPIDGGPPRRLTFHAAIDIPTGFTADGRDLIFFSSRTAGWNRSTSYEVWKMPLKGGTPVRLTTTGGREATTPDDGTTLYYIDGASDSKVQEYRGTANDKLFRQNAGAAPTQMLLFDGNSREPRISRDGKRLYFTREVEGSFELFVCDTEREVSEQLTDIGSDGMSMVALSADEKTITFMWKYYLYSMDLENKGAKPQLLKIEIREDSRGPTMIDRSFTRGIERADLSADGRRIVIELAGDIWIMDANGGTATRITSDAYQNHNPRLSPDGKTIVFYSTRNKNSDLYLIDVSGKGLRRFTTHSADDFFQNWSPDGRSIVFCSERSGNRDIWIKALDGSAAVQLTTAKGGDDDPCFSPDGKLIAFDSARGGNADIYVMNADGSGQRRVYGTPAIEEVPSFSPDGRFIVFDRVIRGTTSVRQEVIMTDLAGSGEVRIATGKYGEYTPDGRDILYVSADGRLFYAPAPAGIQNGRSVPFVARKRISEKQEMLMAFDQAHAAFKNAFYDPKFHGHDWDALGRRYRALVEKAGCREEFLFYLNRMVGEVSASHTGANANTMKAKPITTGLLGMTLVPEPMPGGRQKLKVAAVEKGGPADKSWIRKGDYIFRINGKPLRLNDNLYAHLQGAAGKEIEFFVADNPSGKDFRKVKVTPESTAARRSRHYANYIRSSKQRTAMRSMGQVSYVHIRAMSGRSLNTFRNELASPAIQRSRALIIDVRDNGGGNIHNQLVDLLRRRKFAEIRTRQGQRIGQPTLHWDRPIVVLINERSYSDAEVFPHAMKTLGMATIIGVQTPGAVIGTGNIRLSDGTSWRLPGSGFFNIDGTNQEHNGCVPHITVVITPEDELKGRDTQLDKAIEVLVKQIRSGKKPFEGPEPTNPSTPQKEGEFKKAAEPEADK